MTRLFALIIVALVLGFAPEAQAQEHLGKDDMPAEPSQPRPWEKELMLRRASLDSRLEPQVQGWAVALAVPGALALGGVLALPFRPRGSPEFSLALTLGWLPVAVGLATIASIRRMVRTWPGSLELFQELTAGAWILAFSAATAWTIAVPTGLLAGAFYHPVFVFPIAALPVALTIAAGLMGTWARNVRRSLLSGRGRGHPAPRLLALGPGCLVVEF